MRWEKAVIGQCTLYRGDALEILPMLDPVDALLTDPPYGKPGGARHGEYRKGNARWSSPPRWGQGHALPNTVNSVADPVWIDMALRLARWAIIWGGNYFPLPPMAAWLVWDKRAVGDCSDCELAWTNLAKDSVRRFYYLWNGFRKAHPEQREHPTQKPVALMGWCLDQLPPGTCTVLDPFAGSGSMALACIARGQQAILIERDARWFDVACRRIEEAYAQPQLLPGPQALPLQQQPLFESSL
jgi:DNA modification methylase